MTSVEKFRKKMGFKEPWIGVDLDGVLAKAEPMIFSYDEIGAPISPMVRRVRGWINKGYRVKIFTARVEGGNDAILTVVLWLWRNGLGGLEITNIKDSGMVELWDDLAVNVPINSGKPKDYYKNWKARRSWTCTEKNSKKTR